MSDYTFKPGDRARFTENFNFWHKGDEVTTGWVGPSGFVYIRDSVGRRSSCRPEILEPVPDAPPQPGDRVRATFVIEGVVYPSGHSARSASGDYLMSLADAVSIEVIERAEPAEPWWAHIEGTIVVADGIAFQRNEDGEWISNEDDADNYDELVAAYPGDGRIQHLWSPEQAEPS
jgi:hypothetical protein